MTKSRARTGADFAAKHVRNTAAVAKINAALVKVLAVGPEHWEYESELSKDPYKVSSRDLADFRSNFAAHIITTEVQDGERTKKVWFGSAAVAKRFRPVGQKLEGAE